MGNYAGELPTRTENSLVPRKVGEMYIEIEEETRNYEGPEICTLKLKMDSEACDTIKFFVSALMGGTRPTVTDQGGVPSR